MATGMHEARQHEVEFFTCGICTSEYNEDTRKPKLLSCSHTVCLSCLQAIFRDRAIACPYCRKCRKHSVCGSSSGIKRLPNNRHALQILKLNQQIADLTLTMDNPCDKYWCLTCGFMAKTECCTSRHSILNLSLDAFIDLREEFKSEKTKEKIKLTMGLEMRKYIQMNLKKLAQSLDKASRERQVKELQLENDLCMAEIVSKLGGLLQTTEGKDPLMNTTELFVPEVAASRLDDSTPEEMVPKLKVELNKTLENCEQSLQETTSLSCENDRRKKMKIAIKISDVDGRPVSVCSLLDRGFQLLTKDGSDGVAHITNPSVRQSLILLSHVVSSLIKRFDLDKEDSPKSSSSSSSSDDDDPLEFQSLEEEFNMYVLPLFLPNETAYEFFRYTGPPPPQRTSND